MEDRDRIGGTLDTTLQAAGIASITQLALGNTDVYAQFMIQLNNRPAEEAALKAQGIPTPLHYPTLLCQQAALAKHGACFPHCQMICGSPVAQLVSGRVLSLPMHPYLSDADQERIAASVARAVA